MVSPYFDVLHSKHYGNTSGYADYMGPCILGT